LLAVARRRAQPSLGRRRHETATRIASLRAERLPWGDVAERLAIAVSTAREYHRDPDGQRARERRLRQRGSCPVCGGQTHASAPAGAPLIHCAACRRSAGGRWSADDVVASLRAFHGRHGRVPRASDFASSRARPSAAVAAARFGGFRAAVKAAGMEPVASGRPAAWSSESIVTALRADAAARGHWPRERDWRRAGEGHPSSTTVRRLFGAFRTAVAAAQDER